MKKYIIISKNQKGGSKHKSNKMLGGNEDIINFLKSEDITKIKDNLYDLIQNKELCLKVLGEGAFGRVYVPEIGKNSKIKRNDKTIKVPIVIKESKNTDETKVVSGLDILDGKLYISGYANITTEALILMFTNQLWNNTVHLPYMVGYSTCSKSKLVDKIITVRHGLKDEIELDITGKFYNDGGLWRPNFKDNENTIRLTLNTVNDLLLYIYLNRKDNGDVTLPNEITCCISKLYDYICISYLATHWLLVNNNIFVSDMHSKNIFIHWLDDKSYLGNNIKKIVYKVNGSLYEIETFGFVIILGDLGTSDIKITDNTILVGQGCDVPKNYKLLEQRMKPSYTADQFMDFTKRLLVLADYQKTMAYKLFNSKPYLNQLVSTFVNPLGYNVDYLNKLKTGEEILEEFYKNYKIERFNQKDDNILI